MFRKRRPPVGSRPGEINFCEHAVAPKIYVIDYNKDQLNEYEVEDVSKLASLKNSSTISWIDIQGLGDQNVLDQLAQIFEIHPLAIADVVHIPQRPKVEDYDDLLYIVSVMITMAEAPAIKTEQVSIFLGPGFVITIQEHYGDVFSPIRERLRLNKGVMRKSGGDYLVYAIVDAIIDAIYPVLENLGEYLETLEDTVIDSSSPDTLTKIHEVRKELLMLRRSVYPQRELVNGLIRDHNNLFKKPVQIYLRDCYDHCAQVIEVLESYREMASGLMDVYLSCASNRLNEVMKVLTIISTIFIPMSFLAGVFGMNFEYMPELKVRWAYPAFWLVALALGVSMVYYFRKKGWLGGDRELLD